MCVGVNLLQLCLHCIKGFANQYCEQEDRYLVTNKLVFVQHQCYLEIRQKCCIKKY